MKVSLIRRILREDLNTKEALPDWVDSLLKYVNQNMEVLGKALQGNITFADNYSCKITTLTFTHNTEIIVGVDTTRKVVGLIPVLSTSSSDSSTTSANVITGYRITPKGNGTAGVTINFQGAGSVSASVTVIILYQ
jgi:hypothetical protein